jgi:hypothetical protein
MVGHVDPSNFQQIIYIENDSAQSSLLCSVNLYIWVSDIVGSQVRILPVQ